MQRPLGPRTQGMRPISPIPDLPEPSPLNINKGSRLKSGGLVPSLVIPTPRASNKPIIRVKVTPAITASDNSSDDFPSYYGGPRGEEIQSSVADHDEVTMKPGQDTYRPAKSNTDSLDEVRDMIGRLDVRSSSPDLPNPHGISAEDLDAIRLPSGTREVYSDDRIEELERLGEGAGGAVHKVRDKVKGAILARKTITTREAPMKQLLRELSIISSTKHVNIIMFYGAYISPSSSEIKIIMEYCEGGSLESVGKRIRERGAVVAEKIAGRLAEGILQGLNYLHSKKTIHRDIKPSNILLSREGIVKLCDFGVSGELVNSLAGTFTGTSFYMAPERICGDEYSIRSDVWSTGISLLELVQNKFPFPNDLPPIELMMHITTGDPPRLRDAPGVQWSDEMKDFIKQSLVISGTARPTPRDMLAHPWIAHVMRNEVHMGKWLRSVWGWPKSSSKSGSDSQARHTNGRMNSLDGTSDSIPRTSS